LTTAHFQVVVVVVAKGKGKTTDNRSYIE